MNPGQPTPPSPASTAWQPLTFGGVAAFANASLTRLAAVAGAVAVLVAVVVVLGARRTWWPALNAAVLRLPASGSIQDGKLTWPSDNLEVLADNTFLALLVNPTSSIHPGQSADLQITFAPAGLEVSSLLGYVAVPYPAGYVIALNRREVEPLWGTWQPYLLLGLGALAALGLGVVWTLLAALLAGPVRFYCFLVRRVVTVGGCWRLAVAALLPGATLMALALFLYTLQRLALAELLLANALHLILGLCYLVVAPLRLPRQPVVSPFAPLPAGTASELGQSAIPDPNPFKAKSEPPAPDDTEPAPGS